MIFRSSTMLSIYSTLTREQRPFESLEPGRVRMYVCGVTVYDYCHIGHGRTFVAFDVVRRWLEASGYKVTFVRNITDVEIRSFAALRNAASQLMSLPMNLPVPCRKTCWHWAALRRHSSRVRLSTSRRCLI